MIGIDWHRLHAWVGFQLQLLGVTSSQDGDVKPYLSDDEVTPRIDVEKSDGATYLTASKILIRVVDQSIGITHQGQFARGSEFGHLFYLRHQPVIKSEVVRILDFYLQVSAVIIIDVISA